MRVLHIHPRIAEWHIKKLIYQASYALYATDHLAGVKSGLELGMKFSIVHKNVKSSVSLRSNMISDLDEAIL